MPSVNDDPVMLELVLKTDSAVGRPDHGLEKGSMGQTVVAEQPTQVLLHGAVGGSTQLAFGCLGPL